MAEFSAGKAIGSGLKLIGQRPLSVLAWGLAQAAISQIPLLVIFWSWLPDFLTFNFKTMPSVWERAMAGDRGVLTDPAIVRLSAELAPLQLTQLILIVLAAAVVSSAVYRAVLEPERRAFAYLRLGAQELWVGVSMVGYYLMILSVGVVASAVVGVIGQAMGGASSWGAGLALFLMSCGAIALMIWVALRLSLAGAMSFAERRLVLLPSWKLTEGQGWRLFAIALALGAMLIAVETVILVVAQALGAGFSAQDLDKVQAFLTHPPADAVLRAAPLVAGLAGTQIVVSGLTFALWNAPFAEIYRDLSKPTLGGPVKIKPAKP